MTDYICGFAAANDGDHCWGRGRCIECGYAPRTCKAVNCTNKHYALGYCRKHHTQFKRYGTPYPISEQHGLSNTRTYTSWSAMISRCYNPNSSGYNHYGGRDITVCSEWRDSFAQFVKDMGERPRGKSLDRIDNDGNYEPSNCKWSTQSEQVSNQRLRSKNTSGYVGVSRYIRGNSKKWVAQIRRNNYTVHLGYFDDPSDAYLCRESALCQIY